MRIFLPFSLVSINFAAEFMSMRMKKHLILLLSVLLFCACGGKKEGDVVDSSDLHWDVVERNTTLQLTSAANSPKAELHLIIYYIKDKGFEGVNDSLLLDGVLTPDYLWQNDSAANAAKAADTYIRLFAEDYERDYGAMYRSDMSHASSYNVQFTCKTSVRQSRDHIVNYLAETFYFGGGQHGVEQLRVKNIDTQKRHILQLADLFVPGFEDRLADLVVEQLCHDRNVKNLEELQGKGFFVGMEPYATDNFMVGRNNITFIYGDSEIAPHEEGIIQVELKNSSLKGILKKQ